MSALPIIEAILSAAAPVQNIVSGKVFYSTAPQGTVAPYVIIVGTSEDDETLLAGAARFPEAYVTTVAYAVDYPQAENLGNAIVAALQDQRGTWRGRTATVSRDRGGSFDYIEVTRQHRRIDNFLVRWR
ncbi:DUF3168 domain-containing protein [Mesorhizobium sp. IMUNJ 23232]|uniref:tail completion protein gp17 n=1 Tax=Mesorhizobium sp. IMUNJ 23232 TaxID=3376064 RepID=UPI0037B0DFF4